MCFPTIVADIPRAVAASVKLPLSTTETKTDMLVKRSSIAHPRLRVFEQKRG